MTASSTTITESTAIVQIFVTLVSLAIKSCEVSSVSPPPGLKVVVLSVVLSPPEEPVN